MLCNVTIYGSKDAAPVFSQGELNFDNSGFELKYKIGEDRCTLCANGSTITQSRRGGANMDITFSKGKNTVCVLLSGELTGSVPVKTDELKIFKSHSGVEIYIEYYLGGAKINLRLAATVSPKEIK